MNISLEHGSATFDHIVPGLFEKKTIDAIKCIGNYSFTILPVLLNGITENPITMLAKQFVGQLRHVWISRHTSPKLVYDFA